MIDDDDDEVVCRRRNEAVCAASRSQQIQSPASSASTTLLLAYPFLLHKAAQTVRPSTFTLALVNVYTDYGCFVFEIKLGSPWGTDKRTTPVVPVLPVRTTAPQICFTFHFYPQTLNPTSEHAKRFKAICIII